MDGKPCNDCGASVGEPHGHGCDVARCMWTGQQRIQCGGSLAAACCAVLRTAGREDLAADLAYHLGLDDPNHDCGKDIWTGRWPGEAEAEEFGWFVRWGPPWIECGPDHPDALPNLNRLAVDATWDREAKRWRRKPVN